MDSAPHRLAALLVGGLLLVGACGDDGETDGLDDAAATALVESVLADLGLPGEPRGPSEGHEIPEDELVAAFHCPIQAAGFEVDDVLVALPPPQGAARELGPGAGEFESIDVALLVFDTPATAAAVLDAYASEPAADCYRDAMTPEARVEPVEPLEAGDVTADGFNFTGGPVPPGGEVRTFTAVLGRIMVDVNVFAADDDRVRELAADALTGVVEALREGGA